MATFILNAGSASPISIVCQRAGKGQPRSVGGRKPSYNGADRNYIRGQARSIPIVTSNIDTATEAAIQAAIMNEAQIICSGDILQNLPTLVSVQCVSSDLVPGLANFYVMQLTVQEVNPSVPLARYAPGDTITGESFTRSTVAYQINASGVLESKAINVKRDGHYINGVRSLLLEGARTNNLLWSTDFSNAAWNKTNVALGSGVADPAGGTAAFTVAATLANGQIAQNVGAGSSIVRTNSIWIRRRVGVGAIQIVNPDSTGTVITVTNSWTRVSRAGAAGAGRIMGILITTNGDSVDLWNGQQEDAPFASSDIVTTTTALARGTDFYSLPFAYPPQEMSVYASFIEEGTILGTSLAVFQISNAASNDPRLLGLCSGSYTTSHNNAITPVASTAVGNPAIGNAVELDFRLFADGSVDITQSIASAAATSGAQSAANALASAWSGQLLWLNSAGTVVGSSGFMALRSFKILAGARSLPELRAA